MATKTNSKLEVKYLRWSFSRESLLASEAKSESSQAFKMEYFVKIVKN